MTKGFKFTKWIKEFNTLSSIVDNGTTTVYINTPEGWKCKRKNCKSDFKHTHSTYPCIIKK